MSSCLTPKGSCRVHILFQTGFSQRQVLLRQLEIVPDLACAFQIKLHEVRKMLNLILMAMAETGRCGKPRTSCASDHAGLVQHLQPHIYLQLLSFPLQVSPGAFPAEIRTLGLSS